MSRSSSGSGLIAPVASGQENYKFNVLFDQTSTDVNSHTFVVDNNFVRVAAFNLAPGETVVIEQITGLGAGALVADYAPVHGQVVLFRNSDADQRTSYVLERAGRYRAKLVGGGLGVVHVFAIQYFIENESSQDIADALYAALSAFRVQGGPGISVTVSGVTYTVNNTGIISAQATASVTPTLIVNGTGSTLEEDVNISADAGNQVSIRSDGLYVPPGAGGSTTPCGLGALLDTGVPALNNYVNLLFGEGSACLQDSQLVSAGAGNLIQLRTDGVYYGIQPPANFTAQYVSSSTGDDTNPGTALSPLKTIQKAISNLPDGTMGSIYLYAGDTFHTYTTAVTDTVNTLSFSQTVSLLGELNIGNRQIVFYPYNDTAVDTINAYNNANNTQYDPYVVNEINYPIVSFTISDLTDQPYALTIGFTVGQAGSISFNGCKLYVGKATGLSTQSAAFGGLGNITFSGCRIILSNAYFMGNPNGAGTQNFTAFLIQIEDNAVPSVPNPVFCVIGSYSTINTIAPQPAGGAIYPLAGTFTAIGDNVETFLTASSFWVGIVIYSTATRAYKKVVTSIAIV